MTNKDVRSYKRWTLEEEELLQKLYEKNVPLVDIPDFFPTKTTKQVRAKYDYKYKNKKKATKKSQRWSIKELRILEDNYNIEWEELCKLLPERTETSIKHTLNRRGLKRHRIKITDEVEQQILDMIKAYGVSEIASVLRLSKQSVYNVLKKHEKTSYRDAWILKDAETKQSGSNISITFTINKERIGDYHD